MIDKNVTPELRQHSVIGNCKMKDKVYKISIYIEIPQKTFTNESYLIPEKPLL